MRVTVSLDHPDASTIIKGKSDWLMQIRFAQDQLDRLGALLTGQRGGLRKLLQRLDDVTLCEQLLCLRIAVLLCHARRDPSLEGMRLLRVDDGWRIEVSAEFAATHPRSMLLLAEEAAHWSRAGRVFAVAELRSGVN